MNLEEEIKRLAAQYMREHPGTTPQEALEIARDRIQGFGESTRGLTPPPSGPALGTVPGDIPQINGGLFNPQGNMPQQQQQQPPKSMAQLCVDSGGSPGQDGMCHYVFKH